MKENIKILLVRPVTNKMPIIIPNLGLGYLASALQNNNYLVEILDCAKSSSSFEDFEKIIKKGRFDIIGIQIFTCDFSSAKKMFDLIKLSDEKIITLAGGPHVSAIPQNTMESIKTIDFAFCGEAEKSIVKLCDCLTGKKELDFKEIDGLAYRKNGEVLINKRMIQEDIDQIKMPAWDLINPNTYPHAPHGTFTKSLPSAPIITSRGCPYKCTYCSVKLNTGRKLRKRSPENIIEEIEILVNKYGVKEIHIEDDNFTLDRERVVKFCNLLIEKNLKINWACPNGVRLDTLDAELLQLMEKTGCYSFAIGIESGSDKILKDMKRSIDVEKIKEKVELIAKKTSIKMTGFVMLGYPTETIEDMKMTIRFINSLPINRVQYSNFLPLPGTEIFNDMVEKGIINTDNMDWDNFQDNRVVFSPEGISVLQLTKIIKTAFRKFYLRPKIIFNLIKEIHSLNQFKFVLKRVFDIFK